MFISRGKSVKTPRKDLIRNMILVLLIGVLSGAIEKRVGIIVDSSHIYL